MVTNGQHDLIIRVRMEIMKAQQKIKKLRQSSRNQYKRIAQEQEVVRKKTLQLNKALGQSPFAGWAMSIMFAGMALQRFSMSIYKFGTKAFQEISNSVEGTVTNTDRLQGSMKYLGFTVGQALEPMLGVIIPIVDKIAEWAEANPKLVSTLTSLGIVLGTVLMVGGMARLAFGGFLDMIAKFSLAMPAIKTAVTSAMGGVSASLLSILGIIIGVIALLVVMWKTNFGDMRDFVIDTFSNVKLALSTLFNGIVDIVKIALGIVVSIFEGDWDKVGELAVKLLQNLAAIFLKGLTFIGSMMINIWSFAWNLIVDIVLKVVVGLVNAIGRMMVNGWIKILEGMAWVSEKLGLGRGMFDSAISGLENFNTKLKNVDDNVKSFADRIKTGYIGSSELAVGFENINSTLGLTEDKTKEEESKVSSPTSSTTNIQQVVIQNNDTALFNELIEGLGAGQ